MSESRNAVTVDNGEKKSTAVVKRESRYVVPLADIFETNDAFIVNLDLPGASKETVKITVAHDTLDIRADIVPTHIDGAVMLHREHDTDGYHRAFNLGDGVNHEKINASFEQGILTVTLFKAERAKPREINIG